MPTVYPEKMGREKSNNVAVKIFLISKRIAYLLQSGFNKTYVFTKTLQVIKMPS